MFIRCTFGCNYSTESVWTCLNHTRSSGHWNCTPFFPPKLFKLCQIQWTILSKFSNKFRFTSRLKQIWHFLDYVDRWSFQREFKQSLCVNETLVTDQFFYFLFFSNYTYFLTANTSYFELLTLELVNRSIFITNVLKTWTKIPLMSKTQFWNHGASIK